MKLTKLTRNFSYAALAAIAIGVPVYGLSVCNYFTFGMNGCTTDGCGIGCHVTRIHATNSVCYTGMNTCCACQYYTYECDCIFGPGTGRVAVRVNAEHHICSNGWCFHIDTGTKFIAPMPRPPEAPPLPEDPIPPSNSLPM